MMHAMILLGCLAIQDSPRSLPAMEARLVRPDAQLAALLRLFEDTTAKSPAALLAAYRRATNNPDILGKAPQALIAALNPEMVRELAVFDDTRFGLTFDVEGRPSWFLAVPHDDGTLEALATATAITDGASEAPLESNGARVDRLGRAGAPLLGQRADQVVVASDRAALQRGFESLGRNPSTNGVGEPCVRVSLDRRGFSEAAGGPWARLRVALERAGTERVEAKLALKDEEFVVETVSALQRAAGSGRIEHAWLATAVPDASLGFAWALGDARHNLDLLFALAETVADANLPQTPKATLRTRLNLLANSQGIRPEVELWPRLRGISGSLEFGGAGNEKVEGLTLALHARDEAAARALAERVIPRLVRPLLRQQVEGGNAASDAETDLLAIRTIAIWNGQPLRLARLSTTVVLVWGPDGDAVIRNMTGNPPPPLGDRFPIQADNLTNLDRAVWLRPDRVPIPGLPADSPLRAALDGAEPIVWTGRAEDDRRHIDQIRWPGLRATVRRLVDSVPKP